jgi:hypothetical protein
MRSATWCAPAAPGGCCRTSSHRRARWTGGLPSGPATAPWRACTRCCASGSGSGLAGRRPDGGDHRLPIGPGGRHRAPFQSWLGCRQEGQRPQAASGRGHMGCCWSWWSPRPASRTATPARPLLWRLRASDRGIRLCWADAGYAGKLVAWAAERLRLVWRPCASVLARPPSRGWPAGGWWSARLPGSASTAAPCATTSACPPITPRWSPGHDRGDDPTACSSGSTPSIQTNTA